MDLEFEIEFGALTDEERSEFVALMNERAAHGKRSWRRSKRRTAL